jgi:hypothetical protein
VGSILLGGVSKNQWRLASFQSHQRKRLKISCFEYFNLLTNYNLDESIKYIEVKSSVGKSITNVTLTANEWKKASEFKGTNKYHLYLVTKILKDPEIHDMLDPASWVHSRGLELMVDTYLLYLGQRADEDEPEVE